MPDGRDRWDAIAAELAGEPARPRVFVRDEPRVIVQIGDAIFLAHELEMKSDTVGRVFGSFRMRPRQKHIAVANGRSSSTLARGLRLEDLEYGTPIVITVTTIGGDSRSHNVMLVSVSSGKGTEGADLVRFEQVDLFCPVWGEL